MRRASLVSRFSRPAAAIAAAHAISAAAGGGAVFPYCQIVDRRPEPSAGVQWSLTPSRRVEGGGRFGLAETRGWGNLYRFDTGRGDVELSAEARLWVPTEGGPPALSELLAHLRLNLQWDLRGYNGVTVRLEAEPGLYAEGAALGQGFDVPFSVTGIQSFTDRCSGFAGLRFRARDDRVVDPALGLRWSPADPLILDVGYPFSRALLRLTEWGTIAAGFELNRIYEFGLKDSDERERFRYLESRYFGAVALAIAERWNVELRGGRVAGRDFGFETGPDSGRRKMESGYFIALGITGSF